MDAYEIPSGTKYTQIQFMDDARGISDRPPGNPVVTVILHFDAHHNSNPSPPFQSPVYALFDTGAERCHATPDFISFTGLPQLGTAVVRGGTSTQDGTHHRGHILFPEAKVQIEVDVISAPLRNSLAAEHMLVGMDVISMGRLVMDFKRHIYRLYWA
jgi:hypothetical protein